MIVIVAGRNIRWCITRGCVVDRRSLVFDTCLPSSHHKTLAYSLSISFKQQEALIFAKMDSQSNNTRQEVKNHSADNEVAVTTLNKTYVPKQPFPCTDEHLQNANPYPVSRTRRPPPRRATTRPLLRGKESSDFPTVQTLTVHQLFFYHYHKNHA